MDKRTLDGLRSKVIVTREASVCDQARTGARRRVGPHEVLPPGFTGARVACHAASARALRRGAASQPRGVRYTSGMTPMPKVPAPVPVPVGTAVGVGAPQKEKISKKISCSKGQNQPFPYEFVESRRDICGIRPSIPQNVVDPSSVEGCGVPSVRCGKRPPYTSLCIGASSSRAWPLSSTA